VSRSDLHGRQRGTSIDRENQIECLLRDAEEWTVWHHTSAVHQDVNVSKNRDRLANHRGSGFEIAKISYIYGDTLGLGLGRAHIRETALPNIGGEHPRTLSEERLRDPSADPLRRARYDDVSTRESGHYGTSG
jgi:hypothetical protein